MHMPEEMTIDHLQVNRIHTTYLVKPWKKRQSLHSMTGLFDSFSLGSEGNRSHSDFKLSKLHVFMVHFWIPHRWIG